MLYLLDANVLITAHNQYYPLDVVPQFWAWLSNKGAAGVIKMPLETFEEIKDGGADDQEDPLFAWLHTNEVNKAALLLNEEADEARVQQVLNNYALDLTDDEIEQIGQDPFLIACGLAAPADRCVVTTEVSRPGAQRQNRRVPDVCNDLGVTWCDTFAMLRALQFSTLWQAAAAPVPAQAAAEAPPAAESD